MSHPKKYVEDFIRKYCLFIDLQYNPLTNEYVLWHNTFNESFVLKSELFLAHNDVNLLQLIYFFDESGKEKAEELMLEYKVKRTPLYKAMYG